MKKIFMPFIMALLLTAFAGCADTGSGTGGGSSFNTADIPAGENITLNNYQGNYAWAYAQLTNPRTEAGTYYPVLISNTMGLYSYTALLTSTKNVDTYDGDLTLGSKNYDLNKATPLYSGINQYHLAFTDGNIPENGTVIIAFLTKEEENKFFNVDQLTQSIIDDLNKLDALRQYKWTK